MSRDLFVIAQKAVIKERGKYLIVKRSDYSHVYPDMWELPGGKLEKGEDILKSIEREVIEETSLKVKAIKPVFALYGTIKSEPTVFLFYLCKKLSGKVKLSHEHTEFRWLRKREVLKLEVAPAIKLFFKNS